MTNALIGKALTLPDSELEFEFRLQLGPLGLRAVAQRLACAVPPSWGAHINSSGRAMGKTPGILNPRVSPHCDHLESLLKKVTDKPGKFYAN